MSREIQTVFGSSIYGVIVTWTHDPTQSEADLSMAVTLKANIFAQEMAIRYNAAGSDGTNVLFDDGSTAQTTTYNVGMVWNNPITSDEATSTQLATPAYDGIKFQTTITADDGANTLGCSASTLQDLIPSD